MTIFQTVSILERTMNGFVLKKYENYESYFISTHYNSPTLNWLNTIVFQALTTHSAEIYEFYHFRGNK